MPRSQGTIAGATDRVARIEQFQACCTALDEAQSDLERRREAVRIAEDQTPIVGPSTPPLVRRMQLEHALPSDVRQVGEHEFGPACLLARISDDEAPAAWRELRVHQRALEEVECGLGLPELRAAAHRAWVAAEAAWQAVLAAEPPTLACAVRKLNAIASRSYLYEELLILRDDLSRLNLES